MGAESPVWPPLPLGGGGSFVPIAGPTQTSDIRLSDTARITFGPSRYLLLAGSGYLQSDWFEVLSAFKLPATTSAARPAASSMAGHVIYVSDGGAGAKFQGSDGSAWVNLG